MDKVSGQQCKSVVIENNIKILPCRKCSLCGYMTSFFFVPSSHILPECYELFDIEGPDDMVVLFRPYCACSDRDSDGEPRSWENFADTFNIQTPENRLAMWERFKQGKALYGEEL